MHYRRLGRSALAVSAQGLGCMGMSEFYGPHDDRESLVTLHRALDLGITLLDTADIYGRGHNEELVSKVLTTRRHEVILATKFGNVRAPDGAFLGVDGRPEYVRAACESSLKRLRISTIDLYYQHRVDPAIPIEETVGVMARLVQEGKVRYLGLSEASPATIRRAHSTHPIAALQSEYSLWTRDPEDEVLPTCRELGIGFVAYSPLGRGFLTGQIRRFEDLAPNDYRRNSPRFRARISGAILRWWTASSKWGRRSTASPHSLRWLGSWRRATTLCRSPGPSGRSTWKKILLRLRSS